jgi:hypothetical protein
MEDAYLDCPWRERGVYVGDLLVEYRANLATFGDHKLMRRTIELFLQSQGSDGLIRGGAYVLDPGRYPDYTMLLPLCAIDYVRATGDKVFIQAYAKSWTRLANGILQWIESDTDLIDASDLGPYIDLAQHRNTEPVSLAMNALFVASIEALAHLCESADIYADCAAWRGQAKRTAEKIKTDFWDADCERFTDLRLADDQERTPSIHGNTLACLFNIADENQRAGALRYLRGVMHDNLFSNNHPTDRTHCRVNAYFAHYLIDLLAIENLDCDAIQFISENYGRMIDGGAVTSWEYFFCGVGASRCHAWSAAPTWYMTENVLGVSIGPADMGYPVTVNPKPGHLEWAKGVVPHPAGPIKVRWKMGQNEKASVWIDAPSGVNFEIHEAELMQNDLCAES